MNRPIASFTGLAILLAAVAGGAAAETPYACTQWFVSDKTLRVEARRIAAAETEVSVSDGMKTGYTAREPGTLVGVLQPNAVEGNLALIWQGASAYTLQMLAWRDGKAVVVLSEPSDSMPEFIYPDDKTKEPAVIVTEWEWVDRAGRHDLRPTKARVFGWNGSAYRLSRAVPWESRHQIGAGK
jgi:hypothetical protein